MVLLLVSLPSHSQSNLDLDSIITKSYDDLSDLFYACKSDTLKAKFVAKTFFKKALQDKDTLKMLSGKYYLADIFNNDSIYLSYGDSLLNFTKDPETKVFIILDQTNFHFVRNNNAKTLKSVLKTNTILEQYTNDSLRAINNIFLGYIRGRENNYKEGLKYLKNSFDYLKKTDNQEKNSLYLSLPMSIASIHQNLKNYDSAYHFINRAEILYKKHKRQDYLGVLYYSKAQILHDRKKYDGAINHYKKTVSTLVEDENYYVLTDVYANLGICYEELNFENETYEYFKRADSIYSKHKIFTPNLKRAYNYLINYYKIKSDLENQLLYTNRLINLKEFLNEDENSVMKIFHDQYDIPNLLKEKERLVNQIQHKAQQRLSILFVIIIIILFLLYIQFEKRKRYQQRFNDLINSTRTEEQRPESSIKTHSELSSEIVSEILTKLNNFEEQHGYLNNTIQLKSLAKQFNSNTRYLSKVINQYKETSFTSYINALRINYTLETLKTDKTFRKYTIKAISKEVGFGNAESFSKAFYKKTGIKPSYFIKKLEAID